MALLEVEATPSGHGLHGDGRCTATLPGAMEARPAPGVRLAATTLGHFPPACARPGDLGPQAILFSAWGPAGNMTSRKAQLSRLLVDLLLSTARARKPSGPQLAGFPLRVLQPAY